MDGRVRLGARIAFVVYAVALVTATHWPGLHIDNAPVPRTDLWIHFGAFGGWTALFFLTRWGRPREGVGRAAMCAAIGSVYAAVDEMTQGLPGVNRYVTLSDLGANLLGVFSASIAIGLFVARQRSRGAEDTDGIAG